MPDLNSAFDDEESLDKAFEAEGGTPAAGRPPNPDARTNPQEPTDNRSILRKYADLMDAPGHGKAGGFVGGITGGILGGIPGAMGGAFAGNLIGQRLRIGDEAVAPDQQKNSAGFYPTDYKPAPPPGEVNVGSAAADAATQGAFSGLLRLGGAGAARLGFPRVAAALGASTPRAAVLGATPEAIKGVSTPALQAVDAATLAGNPAAKEIAAISAEQARRDAVLAAERQLSERTMAPIQQRMSGRVPGLAQKTKGFVDELQKAVPADKMDKAFADAPSVAEAASNPTVMGARQQMIQEAVPQTVDNQALKLARRPLAAAEARGVSGPPTQAAADAAGLRELGGNMPMDNSYLTRVVNRVPGVGSAMQLLPRGGLSPDRVAQSTAAVLGSRGQPTINPILEKLVSDNPAYRASPSAQSAEAILRQFLERTQR